MIFTTVHGSHLYGLAHAESDYDSITVTSDTTAKLRQSIDAEGNDRVVVGLGTFLRMAHSGSHQSVEALFSPVKEWSPSPTALMWRPFIEATVIGGSETYRRYERTIRRFCYGDFKRRRHAVRLHLNLADLRARGRFNPRLPPADIAYASELAAQLEGDALAVVLLP